MEEEEKKKLEDEAKEKVGESKNTGKGDKSEALKETERLNAETEGLNKAIAENENAKARQKAGGITEAGKSTEKPKTETPHEYRLRINKELAEGKTEFGN